MAIESHDFGGIRLTDRDAETFIRQVASGARTREAEQTLARGRELLKTMAPDGSVLVSTDRVKGRA